MPNKAKLKELLTKLETLESSLPQSEVLSMVEKVISDKYSDVTSKVKDDSSLQLLNGINSKLDRFKQDFDLKPLSSSIEELENSLGQMGSSMASEFQNRDQASELTKTQLLDLIGTTKNDLQGMTGKQLADVFQKIEGLENQLSFQDSSSKQQGQSLQSIISGLDSRLNDLGKNFTKSGADQKTLNTGLDSKLADFSKTVKSTIADLNKLKKDTLNRFANLGGGNANRNIAIGGNTSILSRYTDINIKAGTNITLTSTNNNTTKYLDLTIASSGGSGTSRSISTVSVSSVVAAVSGTDYVVLANAGIQLTLPTAVGNQNLYTVKNVGTSSVLINTTGGQTIDGQTTLIMPVQYTAVDLISDSANWDIT